MRPIKKLDPRYIDLRRVEIVKPLALIYIPGVKPMHFGWLLLSRAR
jgi:hypothetical protein